MTDQTPANGELSIDVISDVVCPWCYIGKQHLDEALTIWQERNPQAPAPRVSWHPFQLNPTMPAQGMDRGDYLQAKFGDPRGGPGYQRVVGAARAAGLEFNPESIKRQPNTLRAHALIAAAGARDLQQSMVASLFRAYFVDGANIGDEDTLRGLAIEAGMTEAEISSALASTTLEAVGAQDAHIRDQGIGGVPFFVIGQRIAVSGAQGVDALLDAFDRVPAQATE